jgi:hypothetical protein
MFNLSVPYRHLISLASCFSTGSCALTFSAGFSWINRSIMSSSELFPSLTFPHAFGSSLQPALLCAGVEISRIQREIYNIVIQCNLYSAGHLS